MTDFPSKRGYGYKFVPDEPTFVFGSCSLLKDIVWDKPKSPVYGYKFAPDSPPYEVGGYGFSPSNKVAVKKIVNSFKLAAGSLFRTFGQRNRRILKMSNKAAWALLAAYVFTHPTESRIVIDDGLAASTTCWNKGLKPCSNDARSGIKKTFSEVDEAVGAFIHRNNPAAVKVPREKKQIHKRYIP